ncbi:GNAT family N-acetyltransferase [Bacillus marasmi]|uniref:GNAT family N-acetyltransferase n=1 Tax=Bacillus marasmi TaxID=1926279 RepID=UPI0011C895E3|nr:GNAT family N-acetyltransferase [Bacillus marasmi]
MSIKSYNKLTKEIENQIRDIESKCKSFDQLKGNITLDSSINYAPEMHNIFLYFENSKLVSLLTIFMPTAEEAEISAYTLPEFRRKGYFSKLLHHATTELAKFKLKALLFVCEAQSKSGLELVKKLGAELDFTEYLLRYASETSMNTTHNQTRQISVQKASLSDLEALIRLSQDIFEDEYEDAKSMIVKGLDSKQRTQYIASLHGKPVGLGGVFLEDSEACLYGLGILPEFQGKGLGKELLSVLIHELQQQGIKNIMLEVEGNNQTAFRLYRNNGFDIEAAFGYYRKSLGTE